MKTKDMAKKSDKELEKAIFEARTKIASFKRDRYVNDEKNLRQARNMRRDLARMLTELNRRGAQPAEAMAAESEDK